MTIRNILPLTFCLMATPALAAPDWAGYWATEYMNCAKAGQEGEGTPLYLADTEMRGLENVCDIWGVEDGPLPKTYVLSMSCSGEGESYDETLLLMLEGNKLHSWSAFAGEGFLVSYERCQ